MNFSKTIRQFHRWLSIAFTAGFIVNIAAIFVFGAGNEAPFWVYLTVLAPLFLLLPTGLFMFFLPYVSGGGGDQHASDT